MAWMHDIFIESTLVLFAEVSLTGFALILFAAAQGADNMRSGNDMELASARAMERKSGIAIVSALGAAFAICAGLSSPIPLFVLLLASGAAAILIQPALAISIETIFPRRETIEARYRVR